MPGGHGCSAPSPPPGWLMPSPPEPATHTRHQKVDRNIWDCLHTVQVIARSSHSASQSPANLDTLMYPLFHPMGPLPRTCKHMPRSHAPAPWLQACHHLAPWIMQQSDQVLHRICCTSTHTSPQTPPAPKGRTAVAYWGSVKASWLAMPAAAARAMSTGLQVLQLRTRWARSLQTLSSAAASSCLASSSSFSWLACSAQGCLAHAWDLGTLGPSQVSTS